MSDRERLIERILNTPEKEYPVVGGRLNGKTYRTAEMIADHILSDGWIRPPCKVGDKLYREVKLLNGEKIVVEGIALEYTETFENGKTNKRIYFWANGEEFTRRHYSLWLGLSEFGKTVFLTREEAEKALAERESAPNAGDS